MFIRTAEPVDVPPCKCVRSITFRDMVSSPHDAMHRIFREDPGLFARVLPRAGISFPEYTSIEPLDTDLTEIRPMERRVDSFFRVHAAGDEGGFLLAVESQGKPDPDKRNSWTYYLAHMHAKYRLPAFLLVVCRDKATAAWAAEPIRIGRSFHTSMLVFPLVLGPGNLSAITDPEEVAKDVPLAVFAALAHAKGAAQAATLEALAVVMAERHAASQADVETEEGGDADSDPVDWVEYVEIGLGDGPALEYWRHLMATYRPKFPGSGTLVEQTWLKGREEGREEGEAKGRAEDILRILGARGVEVSDSVRERVVACTDLALLGTWFDRSLTVAGAEELFAED